MERETGIEPASLAWKARVLPLNYSRIDCRGLKAPATPKTVSNLSRLLAYMPNCACKINLSLVERAGFEPAYSLEGRFTVCCH